MGAGRWGAGRRFLCATGALAACVAWSGAGSAFAFTAPVSAGPTAPLRVEHLDLNGFFPLRTKIHVGDSVKFSINGFHSVTFLAKGQALPPLIITSPATPITGKLDASGSPLWFNGRPTQIINPEAGAPAGGKAYNGKGFLSSGLPGEGPPKPFVVKFTTAGVYVFHCVVHPGMQGTVNVLPKSKPIPTLKQDKRFATEEVKAAVAQAKRQAKVTPPAATVLAGHDTGAVAWLRFFPQNLTVKAGTSVEFKISSKREVHTITFGPAKYTEEIEKTFVAPLPGGGAGPPTLGVNPLGGYPSDPPPLPPYTGSNHGNGFEGAGILSLGGAPLPSSVKIKFTKAGVYNFECVIHENMDGKVTVTG
jgi:plastocyanin